MPEEEKTTELEPLSDIELRAIYSVAEQYAKPWLPHERMIEYAKNSGLNALLSVPGLSRDLKRKLD